MIEEIEILSIKYDTCNVGTIARPHEIMTYGCPTVEFLRRTSEAVYRVAVRWTIPFESIEQLKQDILNDIKN